MAGKWEWAISREEKITRFANALVSTSDSYHKGFMSKPTWKSHMESLWGQITALGLRENVEALVDPALVGLRPPSEQRI